MTRTYQAAVSAIRYASETRQSELDAAAARARTNCIAAIRAACTEGVAPDSPAAAVCGLAAQTIVVGRDSDNYPIVSLPPETKKVIKAAVAAQIIPDTVVGTLKFHSDLSGLIGELLEAHGIDRNAWQAATYYRNAQTWKDL